MTVNPKEEIKSCPFCGCEAQILKSHISPYAIAYIPECMNPGCNSTMDRFCTEEDAINAWNKRTGGNND